VKRRTAIGEFRKGGVQERDWDLGHRRGAEMIEDCEQGTACFIFCAESP
jgi:hypothetical protein